MGVVESVQWLGLAALAEDLTSNINTYIWWLRTIYELDHWGSDTTYMHINAYSFRNIHIERHMYIDIKKI